MNRISRGFATEENPLVCPRDRIRNIAIIAHVDHGKTTLVDCILKEAGHSHFLFASRDGLFERLSLWIRAVVEIQAERAG